MTFKAGLHNFICDVCGMEYKGDVKRRMWNGLIVCPEDYEVDHPQKYIRVEPDGQAVPDPRPEPTDTFVLVPYYDCAIAGVGVAGIAIAGVP